MKNDSCSTTVDETKTTLFVGGLPMNCSEKQLRKLGEQWGTVTSVALKSREYGFITFADASVADACRNARSHVIDNRQVSIRPIEGAGEWKIFVGGLEAEVTDEDLQEVFSAYGPVKESYVVRRMNSNRVGQSRRFGFVVYSDEASFDNVLLRRTVDVRGKVADIRCAGVPAGKQYPTDGLLHVVANDLCLEDGSVTEEDLREYFSEKYGKSVGDKISVIRATSTDEFKPSSGTDEFSSGLHQYPGCGDYSWNNNCNSSWIPPSSGYGSSVTNYWEERGTSSTNSLQISISVSSVSDTYYSGEPSPATPSPFPTISEYGRLTGVSVGSAGRRTSACTDLVGCSAPCETRSSEEEREGTCCFSGEGRKSDDVSSGDAEDEDLELEGTALDGDAESSALTAAPPKGLHANPETSKQTVSEGFVLKFEDAMSAYRAMRAQEHWINGHKMELRCSAQNPSLGKAALTKAPTKKAKRRAKDAPASWGKHPSPSSAKPLTGYANTVCQPYPHHLQDQYYSSQVYGVHPRKGAANRARLCQRSSMSVRDARKMVSQVSAAGPIPIADPCNSYDFLTSGYGNGYCYPASDSFASQQFWSQQQHFGAMPQYSRPQSYSAEYPSSDALVSQQFLSQQQHFGATPQYSGPESYSAEASLALAQYLAAAENGEAALDTPAAARSRAS